jgi:DNA-directed RNA polymerase subunit E'/Rpb7
MLTIKTIYQETNGSKVVKRKALERLANELTFDELNIMVARLHSISEFQLLYQDPGMYHS